MNERLLPIREVIEVTGLSKATIYRRVDEGRFPHPVKVGARSLWKLSTLQRWMGNLR